MSRICLIGIGVPSFLASSWHAGPGLRSGHLASALLRAGHELLLLCVGAGGKRPGQGAQAAAYRSLDTLSSSTTSDGGAVNQDGGVVNQDGGAVNQDGSVVKRDCHAVIRAVEVEGRLLRLLPVGEADFGGGELAALVRRFSPDALVAATVHAARLALRLGMDLPLWADCFGDLMAEAQAKALVHGNDAALPQFWGTLVPVLERADRFSAVSQAQADALIGQLGLAGRLSAATAGKPLVTVIPCAAEAARACAHAHPGSPPETVQHPGGRSRMRTCAPLWSSWSRIPYLEAARAGARAHPFAPEAPSSDAEYAAREDPRARPVSSAADSLATPGLRGDLVPEEAFIVLWSGSFNTWCDVETLFAGLERAMAVEPSLHFVATGGPVAGHDERSYACFRELLRGSRQPERYHLQGRVDSSLLPAYYHAADIGIIIERDLYERRLGSENRVVQWMAHGLPCLTTARSELGRRLVGEGLAFACEPGKPRLLADRLISLVGNRHSLGERGAACRRYAERHLSFEKTAAPLLDWATNPLRANDSGAARVLSIGLFSEPRAVVYLLEQYLASLTLSQVAFRSVRWLWRRLVRSSRHHGSGL